LNASELGWDIAASYGEVYAFLQASSVLNANRDTKKHPEQIELPAPWPSKPTVEQVTPEEHAALRARLLKHSAFAH